MRKRFSRGDRVFIRFSGSDRTMERYQVQTTLTHNFYKAEIIRVIDGDTVEVKIDLGIGVWLLYKRVRIEDIDCPETRTLDPEEKRRGIDAYERTKSLLPVGTECVFRWDPTKDGGFGRIAGTFLFQDPNGRTLTLGDILLQEGHAVPSSEK